MRVVSIYETLVIAYVFCCNCGLMCALQVVSGRLLGDECPVMSINV
jgi:hypothetical protein